MSLLANPDRDGLPLRIEHTAGCGELPERLGIHKLPAELLHSIFEFAIIPNSLLDPSHTGISTSIWSHNMRTTKSIIYTCRKWYNHAVKFLYIHIAIRRPHQIQALLCSLQGNVKAKWVQEIDAICAFYPEESPLFIDAIDVDEDPAVYTNSTAALIEVVTLCPNLTVFRYAPIHFSYQRDHFIVPIFSSPSLTISTLVLRFKQCPHTMLSDILSHHVPHLRSLSLDVDDLQLHLQDPAPRSVEFPHLKALYCHSSEALAIIFHHWSFPALSQFTCFLDELHGGDASLLKSLLKRIGASVKTLHLLKTWCSSAWRYNVRVDYTFILQNCPNLERLIIPSASLPLDGSYAEVPISEGLRWLAIHHIGDWEAEHHSDDELQDLQKRLPLVRGVKVLYWSRNDFSYWPSFLFNWLEVLPSDLDSKGPTFHATLYNCRITYSSRLLRFEHLREGDLESEYSNDSDYTIEDYIPGTFPSSDSNSEGGDDISVDGDGNGGVDGNLS